MSAPSTSPPSTSPGASPPRSTAVFATIDGWRDVLRARALESARGRAHRTRRRRRDARPGRRRAVSPSSTATAASSPAPASWPRPGFLADAPWHLAWWLGGSNTFGAGPDPELRRLEAVSDPDSEQFRDYTTLEWWRVPARTGTRHLTGPYVDYLCTDDYTVTITTPVRVDGEMVGRRRHRPATSPASSEVLLPVIRESGHPCTLVNASGRIVASTDARRATGALLRLDGLADALVAPARGRARHGCRGLPGGEAVVPCGDTSLALVLEA